MLSRVHSLQWPKFLVCGTLWAGQDSLNTQMRPVWRHLLFPTTPKHHAGLPLARRCILGRPRGRLHSASMQRRTLDVLAGTKSFAGLLLPPHIEQALRDAGFRRPSPVQEAALPLARMGTDLVVQAKAGTGKTLVFAVAAVERVDISNGAPQVGGPPGRPRRPHAPPACSGAAGTHAPRTRTRPTLLMQPLSSALPGVQVLVLAPTREIALQGSEAVGLAAAALPPPGLSCGTFIGGLPVEEDEKQLRRQARRGCWCCC